MKAIIIIAAGGHLAADAAARAAGLEPVGVLEKGELHRALPTFRSLTKHLGAEGVAVYSPDWQREVNPQLFELALALSGTRCPLLLGPGGATPLSRASVLRRSLRLPLDGIDAAAVIATEGARWVLERRRFAPMIEPRHGCGGSVIAIWSGARSPSVGGAVTHVSGILGGFRELGLSVGLATGVDPPPQIAAAVDEVEVWAPSPPSRRMSRDIQDADVNRGVREATARLARHMDPLVLYQRNAPWLHSGVQVARTLGVPLVLEWNGSEYWSRSAFGRTQDAAERLLNSVVRGIERSVLRQADLCVAVSRVAAQLALDTGAPPDKIAVVPNGVDLDAVRAARARASQRAHSGSDLTVGWTGSFGPWHGAEVLVDALAYTSSVRAIFIGDGPGRPQCEYAVARLGLSDRVQFVGQLPHDRALEHLAACDVLVAPQVGIPGRPFHGSPTKLFEYMALGRPVIASDLDQMGEMIDDNRTGRLVPPGDSDALAAVLMELACLPDRGGQLGDAARREAEAQHGWDRRAALVLRALGLEPPSAQRAGAIVGAR